MSPIQGSFIPRLVSTILSLAFHVRPSVLAHGRKESLGTRLVRGNSSVSLPNIANFTANCSIVILSNTVSTSEDVLPSLSLYCLSDKTRSIHVYMYMYMYMCTSEQFSFIEDEDESSHSTLRRYMYIHV